MNIGIPIKVYVDVAIDLFIARTNV